MDWKPVKQQHKTYHQQIVDWFTERIACGDFPVGMKCPTQRALALQFEVNRSTINTAMEELKANGLLETRVGAGTFIAENPWPHLLTHPKWQQHINASIHKPNIETIQLINDYEQREDIIRLGTGELAPALLPAKQLEDSLKLIKLPSRAIGYSEPQGSLALRESLCNQLHKRGIDTTPDNILIVSGALQAFQLVALGLLERGSLVFQQQASYLNSIHPFQSAGMQMVDLDLQSDIVEALQRTKKNRQAIVYSIPTLDNPTGRNWSQTDKVSIYEACKKLSIPILEDDVYGELQFEESNELPMKTLDTTGHVLYIGSVSKTISPGLRIGWVVGPKTVIQRLADIKMQTDYGSSALSQAVVTHWLTSGLYDQQLKNLKVALQQRARYMEQLLECDFKDIATWETPIGGFYIWVRFEQPVITKALFLALLEHKILINPGYIYQPNDFHHLRLSYAYASFEQMEKGLQLLAKMIKKTTLS